MCEEMTKSKNNGAVMVSDVMNTGVGYTDMNLSDRSAAVAFYNATSNPANKLKEHVNEVLSLVHVSVECVEVTMTTPLRAKRLLLGLSSLPRTGSHTPVFPWASISL